MKDIASWMRTHFGRDPLRGVTFDEESGEVCNASCRAQALRDRATDAIQRDGLFYR